LDPGTGIFGFGVVEIRSGQPKMIDGGVITTPAHTPLPERLEEIYTTIRDLIEELQPDEVVIEKLFFTRNITTGISVAEARGVAMLAAHQARLPIHEYNSNQIKQSLTGYGQAKKFQVQEMVKEALGLKEIPKPDDAADALAAAITHYLMTRFD